MKSNFIKNNIQSLLNSDISSTKISEESGANLSIVKKLKSNLQTIENTSFETISKLYDYYLDNHKIIDAQQEVDPKILSQKLPKNIIYFLDELTDRINIINFKKASRVNNVYIYDKYTLDNEGNSKTKESYIKVDESIPISKNNEVYQYQITIVNKIDSRDKFSSINNLTIEFNREVLEIDLKKHKLSGSKIKLNNSKNGNVGIRVISNLDNTDIYNFESNYFHINFKEA